MALRRGFLALKLQNALLGGVPRVTGQHLRTHEIKRSRGRALNKLRRASGPLWARLINAGESHENGVAEQAHYRLKDAIGQALMLRGSRDFSSLDEYTGFVRKVVDRRNRLVQGKLEQERPHLQLLPSAPVPEYVMRKWSPSRQRGAPSLPPHGKEVQIRLYAEHLEVYYKATWWNGWRGCGARERPAWTTATSLAPWCASPGPSPATGSGRS